MALYWCLFSSIALEFVLPNLSFGERAVQGGGPSNDQGGLSKDEKFAVSAPSITLPKGGGAISGIGEKFSANPVTGTGSMTVPIFTSPGRSRLRPAAYPFL